MSNFNFSILFSAEQRIDKFSSVERLQVLGTLSKTDIAHGNLELIANANDHSSLGTAVKLGDCHACDFRCGSELLCLLEGILAGAAVEDEHQKAVMDMVTNLLIEVFGFVAEEERNMIRARQAEGIAAWRRTGKTRTGRPYGRPRKEISDRDWEKVISLLAEKRIKTKEAWKLLGVAKNTYYRLLRRRARQDDETAQE